MLLGCATAPVRYRGPWLGCRLPDYTLGYRDTFFSHDTSPSLWPLGPLFRVQESKNIGRDLFIGASEARESSEVVMCSLFSRTTWGWFEGGYNSYCKQMTWTLAVCMIGLQYSYRLLCLNLETYARSSEGSSAMTTLLSTLTRTTRYHGGLSEWLAYQCLCLRWGFFVTGLLSLAY